MKKRGFTLSEVLVTLGILGVVASMTIPTVVADYKKQAYATSLRKNITEILEALDLMMTEEGKNYFLQTSMFVDESADNFIENYLSFSKRCETHSDCFADAYSSINGAQTNKSLDNLSEDNAAYLLKNGAAIIIDPYVFKTESGNTIDRFARIDIYIDTNGKGNPNKGGRDMFKISLSQDYTNQNNQIEIGSFSSADCEKNYQGGNCYQKLVEDNWKMKY